MSEWSAFILAVGLVVAALTFVVGGDRYELREHPGDEWVVFDRGTGELRVCGRKGCR